jgi:hypothetical protein
MHSLLPINLAATTIIPAATAAAAAARYAENLPQLESGRKISPNPADWRCDETGVTENLWLNLSTGHIGSGRQVSSLLCYFV